MLRTFSGAVCKERERERNREGATKSAVVGAYEWRDFAVGRSWLESMEKPTDWLTGHCLLASEHNRKQIKLLLPIMHTNLCTHGNGKHHLPPPCLCLCLFCTNFPGENGQTLGTRCCRKLCVWNMQQQREKTWRQWSKTRLPFHEKRLAHTAGNVFSRAAALGQHIWLKRWKLKTGSQMLRDHIIQVVSQSAPVSDEVLVNAPWS